MALISVAAKDQQDPEDQQKDQQIFLLPAIMTA